MRVAMVNTEFSRGGAARMASTLVDALIAEKTDVCLYHAGDRVKTKKFYGMQRVGSKPLNALMERVGGSMFMYDMGLTKDLLHEIETADLLHVHNLHGYYINYTNLLYTWRQRPIVWTWHDFWAVTGRCCLPNPDCGGWRNGCGKCPYPDVYPAAWLDWSARDYRSKSELYRILENLTIVTPANWLAEMAIERGFSSERIRVIPNPVDITKYCPQPQVQARQTLGYSQNEPLILFVASDCNDPRKGYPKFCKLIESTGYHGIAVGIPSRQTNPLITQTGSISDPATLSLYYSAADLLVMTTQADNYPNVIIEAMACGTPVLSYGVGGIADQMPTFWNGVVPLNDDEQLLVRCQNIIRDRNALSELRSAFREHATTTWNPRSVARQYNSVYREAASLERNTRNNAFK
ncbi:glycosyltransferase [Methyloterricola oryzae]|uniref:glycosyltransferase n=1 Tax=Methyloterricola oryzae TaxID=1495050 RepID=UPI0009E321FA|nr:glycosyltransferase [Methyloterricola oryzae]